MCACAGVCADHGRSGHPAAAPCARSAAQIRPPRAQAGERGAVDAGDENSSAALHHFREPTRNAPGRRLRCKMALCPRLGCPCEQTGQATSLPSNVGQVTALSAARIQWARTASTPTSRTATRGWAVAVTDALILLWAAQMLGVDSQAQDRTSGTCDRAEQLGIHSATGVGPAGSTRGSRYRGELFRSVQTGWHGTDELVDHAWEPPDA